MPFDFGGDRHESGVKTADLMDDGREAYSHQHECDDCGELICDCGIVCDAGVVEATRVTVPGYCPVPFLRVCVECAKARIELERVR